MDIDFVTFDERVSISREEYVFALRSKVQEWTQKELSVGNKPYLGNFIDEYPEWNKAAFYDIIEAELDHTSREGS